MKYLKLLLLISIISISSCSKDKQILQQPQNTDTEVNEIQKNSPYVVLVSFDGYRYDYTQKYKPSNIRSFIKGGVEAEGIIPIYPSLTFPNHYALVTGMRSENHGIVQNKFYDSKRDETYHFMKATGKDGSWYTGEPLWKTASKQGLKAASYFWVGSDAKGNYPDYWFSYNGRTSKAKRVDQVIEWLKLPLGERPNFITLYFSEVDSKGHKKGPDSPEVQKAVHNVDKALGRLMDGIDELDLPVNVILVSDHGMQKLYQDKVVYLDDYLKDLNGIRVVGGGAHTNLYIPNLELRNKTYKKLENASHITVYKKENIPKHFGYSNNHRIGDLVISTHSPYYLIKDKSSGRTVKGATHGFEPLKTPSMNGIFYANGPSFKKGLKIPAFENIHVYPMILEILGLKLDHKIDGSAEVLKPILAE
jgi:predicted AlkP superfamily pyrophosphatase or phosphodiesterase